MKTLPTALFLIFTNALLAQFPVGHYMDSQGMPIVGYFDPLEYENPATLTQMSQIKNRQKGYYYDPSGAKHKGEYTVYNNSIEQYHDFISQKNQKLRYLEAPYVVIGIDSFFVENKFQIKVGAKVTDYLTDPQYLKYIASFDSADFVSFNRNNSTSDEPIYLFRKWGTDQWVQIPKQKSEAKKLFTEPIRKIIEDSNPYAGANVNFEYFLKVYHYQSVMNSNGVILFDRWWNIVNSKDKAEYELKVAFDSSLWKLNYYQQGTLINVSRFKTLVPQKRNGASEWYYPSGQLRKQSEYKDDVLMSVKHFFENGQLHYHYKREERTNIENLSTGEIKLLKFKYYAVFNNEGKRLLNDELNGVEEFVDEINGRTIHREFANGKIVLSTAQKGDEVVFQWIEGKQSLFSMKSKLKTMIKEYPDWDKGIDNNQCGDLLFILKTNSSGELIKMKKILSINFLVDGYIERFFNRHILSTKSILIGKQKINKEYVPYEVALPYKFVVAKSVSTGYDGNMFMHMQNTNMWQMQQQMMQQQMMQQQMMNSIPKF